MFLVSIFSRDFPIKRRSFLVILFVSLFVVESSFGFDAASLIPYMAEQIEKAKTVIDETKKLNRLGTDQLNVVNQLKMLEEKYYADGDLSNFSKPINLVDEFLYRVTGIDKFSQHLGTMLSEYEGLYRTETFDIDTARKIFEIKEDTTESTWLRSKNLQNQSESIAEQLSMISKEASDMSSDTATKKTVEVLGHVGQLMNTMIQNQAQRQEQAAREVAEDIYAQRMALQIHEIWDYYDKESQKGGEIQYPLYLDHAGSHMTYDPTD